MDDITILEATIPSLSSGQVGSRFVTETEITKAKTKRDEEWAAAYARLGQEPPPRPVEDVFDGRSLAEKLASNKAAKQEEWEEKQKLSNQFRALEEDEIQFLDTITEKQADEERQREMRESEDLVDFRIAVAALKHPNPSDTIKPKIEGTGGVAAPGRTSKAQRGKSKAKPVLKGVQISKKRSLVETETSKTSTPIISSSNPKRLKLENEEKKQKG